MASEHLVQSSTSGRRGLLPTAAGVLAFALAMAYLEAAVVVYLQAVFGARVGEIFPLRPLEAVGDLIFIELGREAATLVMIAAVGILVGRTPTERLAWSAVVFGAWDIGYYLWLYVFSGWPPSLATPDLLFLIPAPWVGPVWAPVTVSLALVGFGLLAARREREGRPVVILRRHLVAGVGGGLVVVAAFLADAPRVTAGELPGEFPVPVFAAGLALAAAAAVDALRRRADATSRRD